MDSGFVRIKIRVSRVREKVYSYIILLCRFYYSCKSVFMLLYRLNLFCLHFYGKTIFYSDFRLSSPQNSIVVHFLCKTDKSIYELGQMIVSGFMHSVFAAIIESVSPAAVDVNVDITADEVDLRLLCLSSPQDKGWSIAVW